MKTSNPKPSDISSPIAHGRAPSHGRMLKSVDNATGMKKSEEQRHDAADGKGGAKPSCCHSDKQQG